MIEQIKVIRCDAPYEIAERPPRPGRGPRDGRARTGQCTRHFPIRTGLPAAWEAARKRGWRQGRNANGRPMQYCPDHAMLAAAQQIMSEAMDRALGEVQP